MAVRRAGPSTHRMRPGLALIRGRLHLSIEDVTTVAPAVLRHRIILNFDAHADGETTETVLNKVLKGVAPS